MRKGELDDLDQFFGYDLFVPKRTLYLGSCSEYQGSESGIDFKVADRFIKALLYLEWKSKTDPIIIHINNVGGDQYHGIAIYAAIRACQAPVAAVVWGQAMSMGAVVLQAADCRIMTEGSVIMIHDGSLSLSDVPCKVAERWADESRRTRKEMYRIFHERMREMNADLSLKDVEDQCSHDSIFDAKRAISAGLADQLLESFDELNNLQFE